jgi:hypothetical protein
MNRFFQSSRNGWKTLPALVLLAAISLVMPSRAAALVVTNVQPVNVTASAFSILFQTITPTTPEITLFSDAAGTASLAGVVGIEPYPVHSGEPSLTDPVQRRRYLTTLRQKSRDTGFGYLKVSECLPNTTYYYRLRVTDTNGQSVVWPASGPLPSVRTASETSFVLDAKLLVVELPGPDSSGTLVALSNTNAAFGLVAVAGDGCARNQVVFFLSDLIALTGGKNFIPLGNQEFQVKLLGPAGSGAANRYALSFIGQLAVADVAGQTYLADILSLDIGSTALRAGQTGVVPIHLLASTNLSSLDFDFTLPTNHLTNVALQLTSPALKSGTLKQTSPGLWHVALAIQPGGLVQSTQQVAQINFLAVSNQLSSFVPFVLQDIDARRPDASPITTIFAHSGRVVVVAEQPLLEAVFGSDGAREMAIYGKPGAYYEILVATNLANPIAWKHWGWHTQVALAEQVTDVNTGFSPAFFRASEPSGSAPGISAKLAADGSASLTVFGQPGVTYQLQSSTDLSGVVIWVPQLSYTLSNSFQIFNGFKRTNPLTIYRVVKP